MIRAVCFDFGNVLAAFDHRRAVRRLAPSSALDERTLFEAVYNLALEHDYEAGRLGTAEFVAEARRVGRLSCSDEQFLAASVDIFTPNAEVCALVPRLRPRYKLLLASNTNEAHARQFRRQFA
jgi:glucose-1-phosphatase